MHPVTHRTIRHYLFVAAVLALALSVGSSLALAQYKATTLVKSTGKKGDSDLINPWGLAYGPSAPFWLSDEGWGVSTLYTGTGVKQSLIVTVPSASGSGLGSPTGIVYNGGSGFSVEGWPSVFIFDTLDGTISGWAPQSNPNNAIIAVNNAKSGAIYTGLAISSSSNMIYAADWWNNKVDVYNESFQLVNSFTDSKLPAGFVPFGIQDINGQVYVAFANANPNKKGGYVDIFTEGGTFVKTLISGAPLDQPWGFAVAPSNFGTLSNTLLISNNTNTGTINGFNLTTGAFVGTVETTAGKAIKINQLWGIEFGGGSSENGNTNQLFYTAGPKNNAAGIFGVINVN